MYGPKKTDLNVSKCRARKPIDAAEHAQLLAEQALRKIALAWERLTFVAGAASLNESGVGAWHGNEQPVRISDDDDDSAYGVRDARNDASGSEV